MILHRQGTQPRLIDSSEHSSINLNLRKRNSIYNIVVHTLSLSDFRRVVHSGTYLVSLLAIFAEWNATPGKLQEPFRAFRDIERAPMNESRLTQTPFWTPMERSSTSVCIT